MNQQELRAALAAVDGKVMVGGGKLTSNIDQLLVDRYDNQPLVITEAKAGPGDGALRGGRRRPGPGGDPVRPDRRGARPRPLDPPAQPAVADAGDELRRAARDAQRTARWNRGPALKHLAWQRRRCHARPVTSVQLSAGCAGHAG